MSPGKPLRVVAFTRAFPNPEERGLAPFVRARLQHAAAHPAVAGLKVVAPVPLLDYSHPAGRLLASRRIPPRWMDGSVEVFHPRWLFAPGGTPLNVACLAAQAAGVLRRLRRGFPFDLLDAHFGFPDGAAARRLAAWFGVPYFVTLRGNELLYAADRWRAPALRAALRDARGVIAVSEQLRQLALDLGVPAERARCIPNGVDASVFYPRPRAAVRDAWQLPADAPLILSAGGLGPGKGYSRIIRSLAALRAAGSPARLWIAGAANRDGDDAQGIRALIAGLGLGECVRLLGALEPERLAGLMSACDVFCLASAAEGWPNVVQEALACGAPVVATRVGAIPQMIPSRQYGFIVDVDDHTALTECLRAALEQPWDRAAIQRWGQARSWTQVAAEVAAFWTERLQAGS